jgi:iron complex outermembrane receptor protein
MKSPKISMIRAALLASIAVSGLAVTAPVMAQEEAARAENGDEIIVTARRREENLLDVPIAVSAFSGEALELRGALDPVSYTHLRAHETN